MFSLTFSLAGAGSYQQSYVNVLEPYTYTLHNNGTVFLGKVGPGQPFYVTISSETINKTGSLYERGWNEMVINNAPQGWVWVNSSLYNSNLSVKITPPATAQNGTYTFDLAAVNIGNYSQLGALHFKAVINVTPDVFVLSVHPKNISTGPGEPASVYVTINNTGVSDSPFIVNVTGLPAFNLSTGVIALHGTTQNFTYGIYEDEPGIYHANISVVSVSSPLVKESTTVNMTIEPSVLNDYKAIGQGAITFPVIFQPMYYIMYLISKLFG